MRNSIEQFDFSNEIKEENLHEIISRSKALAEECAESLDELGIEVEERHNVLVPGTPATIERSENLLRDAIRENDNKASVYTGIDICRYICKFCRYYNRTAHNIEDLPQKVEESIENLIKEINMETERLSPNEKIRASSIYIGGGTPTLMSEEQMNKLFENLQKNYDIENQAEITMECTPDTIDTDKLAAMRKFGVNRISIGVQRLNDEWLLEMGRKHNSADVVKSLKLFKDEDMRFNVDLMYGFDGQSIESFANDLLKILEHEPPEITLYRFENQKRTDDKNIKIEKMNRKNIYAMQQVGREILQKREYIEGPDGWFTKKGYNRAQVYADRWKNQIPLLGFGPEAYSFSKYQQQTNKKYTGYISSLVKGHLPIDSKRVYEYAGNQKDIRRMIFDLKSTFQTEIDSAHKDFFTSLSEKGLGEIDIVNEKEKFKLNERGIIVVEEIMRVLVEENKNLGEN